jgi:ubiquinone/menaquinone biosynthesis C-methylase UbiE
MGLDVGVGSADSIAYARRHATTPIEWTGLDLSCDVLRVAQEICSAPLLCASSLHLPFADGRFDVVTCAHVLHHLEPGQVSSLLHECARVARRRLVVLDLARNYIALAGAWLLTRATSRNRLTLADGMQSVRRAYTPEEAAALAEQAGLADAKITARNPFRYALVWSRSE